MKVGYILAMSERRKTALRQKAEPKQGHMQTSIACLQMTVSHFPNSVKIVVGRTPQNCHHCLMQQLLTLCVEGRIMFHALQVLQTLSPVINSSTLV